MDLLERPPFHDHLLVDAPELLWPAIDVAVNPYLLKTALHFTDQLCEVEVPLGRPVLRLLGYALLLVLGERRQGAHVV